ncbi:hypothetical protein ACFY2R_04640 [Micromonospora olivasterospora]|uniref:Uncharacterized protein n=1 Tax=Micromonospora olivasterospora TaxID=1880 RepID=A0A562IDS5_MICOL|nr:hypothetical protein [Micromonospora olivasterospora]TWH69157.1 hypothetical protein JD77_04164 [Micromonospora olivasterospora]
MSTQAASTRPMNRPTAQEAPNRPMQEAPTRPMPAMYDGHREAMQAPGTETKNAFKTTEFWVYAASVAAVLIASYLVGKNSVGVDIFRAPQAWFFITLLTIGYLGSRGLAKAGSNYRSATERKARH